MSLFRVRGGPRGTRAQRPTGHSARRAYPECLRRLPPVGRGRKQAVPDFGHRERVLAGFEKGAGGLRLHVPALPAPGADRLAPRVGLLPAKGERGVPWSAGGGEDPPGDQPGDPGDGKGPARVLRLLEGSGRIPPGGAETKNQLRRRLRVLTHPALLVVDEIGYLPVTRNGKTLFFQLINERYEPASTVLTSNKGFEEWETIVGDEVMAAALLDRLLRHCQIVNIRGNSYRMRQRSDLAQALPQVPARKNPEQGRLPKPRRPVRRHARRARVPGRSAPSVRARRAHPGTHPPPPLRPQPLQIPSTHPSTGTQSPRKSGTFSKPRSGTFSTPIDTHSAHRLTSKPVIQSRKAKTNAVSKVSVLHTEFLTVLDRSRNRRMLGPTDPGIDACSAQQTPE